MNINRDNYEEYFLLYIDNELSVAERNIVDAFIASNPDLAEELVMLQQSILKPDTVEFPGKEKLIKQQTLDTETREELLLMLDNELPANKKDQIHSLINTNEAVKKEWELLQQTKLYPGDTIIFEDKPSLYRKETKVIPVAWWRIAAAAILIGFGLWGTVSYLNRNTSKDISGETAVNPAKNELPANSNISNATLPGNDKRSNDAAVIITTQNKMNKASVDQPTPNEVIIKTQPAVPETKNNNTAINDNEKDASPDDLNNINSDERNKKIFASVSPETNTNKPESTVDISSSLKNDYAVNTSFSSNTNKPGLDTFDEEEEDKPRKTRIGGFFKKVKRVIERKTKIKTGSDDEVRIANMSFAMH